MKKILLLFYAAAGFLSAYGQYAPQAGVAGSTGVPAGSPLITGWASSCSLNRGYMDIAQPSLGLTTSGDSSAAIGSMDHIVVSLGDSGVATLHFSNPVVNGPGPDFAVFENGFPNPANNEEAFLELAFVEVSSDGINFFRFPAASLTQDTSQLSSVAGQNYMNARLLNNLAGKYISNYGTPFDLQELAGIAGLNVNYITHIRLVDVTGSVGEHASYDASQHKINDPYPTAFPTGGFDLDAVGALHQLWSLGAKDARPVSVLLYPNPAISFVTIEAAQRIQVELTDVSGRNLYKTEGKGKMQIPLESLVSGLYFVRLTNDEGVSWAERIYKR